MSLQVAALENAVQSPTDDINCEDALETTKETEIVHGSSIPFLSSMIDVIPAVGHATSFLRHLGGDHESGNNSLIAETRTIVDVGSGVVAGLATRGIVAITAEVDAGDTYRLTATEITHKLEGSIVEVKEAVDNPSAGDTIETIASPVCDDINESAPTKLDLTDVFTWFKGNQSAFDSSSSEDGVEDSDALISSSSSSKDDDSSSESSSDSSDLKNV